MSPAAPLADGTETLAVGDPVYWETPWSKRIAALIIEVDDQRARVVVKRRRQITDGWTPLERLTPTERTPEHRRLEAACQHYFQRSLFP